METCKECKGLGMVLKDLTPVSPSGRICFRADTCSVCKGTKRVPKK